MNYVGNEVQIVHVTHSKFYKLIMACILRQFLESNRDKQCVVTAEQVMNNYVMGYRKILKISPSMYKPLQI